MCRSLKPYLLLIKHIPDLIRVISNNNFEKYSYAFVEMLKSPLAGVLDMALTCLTEFVGNNNPFRHLDFVFTLEHHKELGVLVINKK